MTAPTWRAWQVSVPTTGLMHSDQRQPGCIVKRATLTSPRPTDSTVVLSGVRVSSAASKFLLMIPAMRSPFSIPADSASPFPSNPRPAGSATRPLSRAAAPGSSPHGRARLDERPAAPLWVLGFVGAVAVLADRLDDLRPGGLGPCEVGIQVVDVDPRDVRGRSVAGAPVAVVLPDAASARTGPEDHQRAVPDAELQPRGPGNGIVGILAGLRDRQAAGWS